MSLSDGFTDLKPSTGDEHYTGDECWCEPERLDTPKGLIFLHKKLDNVYTNGTIKGLNKGGSVKLLVTFEHTIKEEDLEHIIDEHLPTRDLKDKVQLLNEKKLSYEIPDEAAVFDELKDTRITVEIL